MDPKLFATVFSTVLIAELGDKTQLATMLYASDASNSRLTVFVASALALIVASALGVLAGSLVAQWVSPGTLMAKIIKPGNDKRPKNRNTKITVHYQGKHIDGRVFDSTFSGEPASFRVREVIKGWQEGVQHVGEGGQIVLYVPPELAYGRRGSAPTIGRYETLIFIIVPVAY